MPWPSAVMRLRAPPFSLTGLRLATGNVVLAAAFFVEARPSVNHFGSRIGNAVWILGACIMACLSLVRLRPREVMLTPRALAASAAMIVLASMLRPNLNPVGLVAWIAAAIELLGLALSQSARLYLGRSFGILPANRGIVDRGPFRWIRHPIYAGWCLLALGYVMAWPTWQNWALLAAAGSFMWWRIKLEEELLSRDSNYGSYMRTVPYRIIPGLI